MSELPRLLIVERSRLTGETLAAALTIDFDVVGVVGSGLKVFAALRENHVDLVLVDLCLPDLTGRQVIGEIRLLDKNARIAGMSEHDGPGYRESLRLLGANGFLWKGVSLDSCRMALRQIVSGNDWVAVPEWFEPQARLFISDLEHQILECLAGYPIKAIGRRLGISTRRVESIFQRLRRRFRVASNIELMREAIRLGYMVTDAKSA